MNLNAYPKYNTTEGKTNLIDFTTDYLIALFMACDGSRGKDGRVILQEKEQINPYIQESYEPINRVIAQKSVFVRHPDGFIQPNGGDVINIPAGLKQPDTNAPAKFPRYNC